MAKKEETRTIVVPLGAPMGHQYIQRHLNVQLAQAHGLTLRALRDGLDARGATLTGGRHVQTNADAVKWLLEAVAAATE